MKNVILVFTAALLPLIASAGDLGQTQSLQNMSLQDIVPHAWTVALADTGVSNTPEFGSTDLSVTSSDIAGFDQLIGELNQKLAADLDDRIAAGLDKLLSQ